MDAAAHDVETARTQSDHAQVFADPDERIDCTWSSW